MGGEGGGRGVWRRLLRHRRARVSLAVLVVLAAACGIGPALARAFGVDPAAMDLLARLEGPSLAHPLGTDELGRDLLLRLLDAGRVSLSVGVGGALLAAALGTLLGVLAGWFGGRLDALVMRLTDAVLALPLLPLLLVLAAVDLDKLGLGGLGGDDALWSAVRIVVIVALFGWTTTARLARAATLSVRERDYVLAARALGARTPRILLRHVLPNVASPLVVAATLSVGQVVLAESVLSFLGLGIQPPLASWGTMLTGAQERLFDAPMLALWPGLLIFLTVLCFNLLGDGLQEALDPRSAQALRRAQ